MYMYVRTKAPEEFDGRGGGVRQGGALVQWTDGQLPHGAKGPPEGQEVEVRQVEAGEHLRHQLLQTELPAHPRHIQGLEATLKQIKTYVVYIIMYMYVRTYLKATFVRAYL